MDNFLVLDLEEYFNNNGFSYRENIVGDFTDKGHGSVFPSEELPDSNSMVLIHKTPFRFPSKESNNNFELNDQKIMIPPNYYKKIHFLCAADTGSFYETIKIGNRHNEFKYKVGFTDWTSTEPVYSEKVAFRCKKAYTHRGEVNTETTIWYQMLILNDLDINYIKFRDNPSVHIFSITLEKGDI